jgi:hypothetical protein
MNSCQSGGAGDKSNELKIFPLRNEDLVFSKNSDGILSCGYKVSNALLNATLSMPMVGGDKHAKKDNTKHKAKTNENEIKSAKIMEDLVIPSSLYYGKPVSSNKVFNYKKGKRDKRDKRDKDKKGRDSSSDNESDDDVIEESIYDKLLSLVSLDNKIKYNKKTRKNTDNRSKAKISKDTQEEKTKENKKIKNKKTKKVTFNV